MSNNGRLSWRKGKLRTGRRRARIFHRRISLTFSMFQSKRSASPSEPKDSRDRKDETPRVPGWKLSTDLGYASMPVPSILDSAAIDDYSTIYSIDTIPSTYFIRLITERLYTDCLIADSELDQSALSQALEGIGDLICAFAQRVRLADPTGESLVVAKFASMHYK